MTTYAIRGLMYVVAQPSVWMDSSLAPMAATIAFGMCVAGGIVAVGLHPQAYLFERVGLPAEWAVVCAIAAVVVEVFLTTVIYSLLFAPCYESIVVKKVLEARGHFMDMAAPWATLDSDHPARSCCRRRVRWKLAVLIASIPLHCVPVVGTIAFVWLNGGHLAGWDPHQCYFDLKGYSVTQRKAIFTKHRDTYTSLATQSMWLQAIPFVGFVFTFTNTVGAALFAADLEDELITQSQSMYGSFHTINKEKMLYI
ncbi:hypothetical protein H310_05868 [Aphanomyces invadans]|uniref:Uncharacterized protein n=1 Tax=Aphanomyces invadans TaxID=157072 RepID=A0A024U7Y6_9STRA|nr:hypothetical protein H310_05868 [Aphanomyces invadans]ETW02325.1 hypothetical protein H310_05868 [Aphanomyces invadans]|eukprot:XP_008868930.1 hypothetical protein H310_05868 [Aphanomyces invadans]